MNNEEYFYKLCRRRYDKELEEAELKGYDKPRNPYKKKRKCNKCGQYFVSHDYGNRRCPPCQHLINRTGAQNPNDKYNMYLQEILRGKK